jgi:hypothetical protein
MISRKDLHQKIAERFGPVIDQRSNPDVFHRLVDDIAALLQQESTAGADAPSLLPFGVSWMDSWVAHWVYAENLRSAETRNAELATALRGLVDVKFNERLAEIKRFLRDHDRLEPPDGGPPEPGTPPAGPSRFADEPPDGGTPEPGVPPPPEPPGPEPPPGPDAGLRDNPWILYWFVSIRTPLLLDVIDAHVTRRLNELRGSPR